MILDCILPLCSRLQSCWRDVEEFGCSSEHGKVLRCFCTVERSSIRRSRAYARVYVYVYIFFILGLFPHQSLPLLASVTTVERDGDALFPPPSRSFHLFRRLACLAATSFLFPSSLFICLPLLLFFSLPPSLSPLLFMVDPSGGRIDSTLSRHIREYTFNARRRRIYSPAYFSHFDEWRATSHATSLNVLFAWFFTSNKAKNPVSRKKFTMDKE